MGYIHGLRSSVLGRYTGVYVRFSTQLELLRAQGLRNMMADWRVVSADLLAAVADQQWDTVHVKIVGEARDRDVAVTLSPSEALAQTKKAELSQYHEVWSFVRQQRKHCKLWLALKQQESDRTRL